MAFELFLTKERIYELLELTVNNGARPVIIIEDEEDVLAEELIDLIFGGRKDTQVFDYSDFVMDRAFNIEKIKELASYCFVIIENVKYLYGKSATSKILLDFAETMTKESTAVIFVGKRTTYDMAEFIDRAGDLVHYIIRVDSEGN